MPRASGASSKRRTFDEALSVETLSAGGTGSSAFADDDGNEVRLTHVRRFPEKSALAVRRAWQDRGHHRGDRRIRGARRQGAGRGGRQRGDRGQQGGGAQEDRGGMREARRQGRGRRQAAELGSQLRRDRQGGGRPLRPPRYPGGGLRPEQGGEDRRPGGGRFPR